MTEPVPPAVRAQILATEHWGLLAVRSQTWSEVMGRITSQLMFTSAILCSSPSSRAGAAATQTFRLLAVVLGLTLLTTGTLTAFRVANASQEDYMFIKGMNRLRAAYLEIDPSLAPYFITGVTDDEVGIGQTYTMGPVRNASQVAASAGIFITSINTIVAGGVTVFLLWPWAPGQLRSSARWSGWATSRLDLVRLAQLAGQPQAGVDEVPHQADARGRRQLSSSPG